MATLAALKKRAANKLGFSPNNTLSAMLNSQMQSAYEEVYYELEDEGLTSWVVDGDIPDKLVSHIADLMAFKRFDVFPTSDGVAGSEGKYVNAMRMIHRLQADAYSSTEEPKGF